MTTTDPWANTQSTASNLACSPEPEVEDEGSSLFGLGKTRSLFNSHVKPNTPRVGIIAKPPVDRQSYNIEGKPKFWDPESKSVVTFDTGRPMKDTVITLDTEYRFTADELADEVLGIDAVEAEDDTGRRSLRLNGELKKAMISAIKENRIPTNGALVGWKLTIDRGRKIPIGGGKSQWQGGTVTLSRP